MSDQDLLDIIESLKTLQIQQQQIIRRQQELTKQFDHILAVCGGGMANPHRAGTVSPDTSATSNPHCADTISPVTSGRVSPTISHRATSLPTNNTITSTGPSTLRHTFVLGKQVHITNRITHSVTPGLLDRAAIVTRVRSR